MQLFYPSCGSKKTVPCSSASSGSEVIESLVPGQIFTGFSLSFDNYFVFEKRLASCKTVGLWHLRQRWEADDPAVGRLWRCSGPPPWAVGVVGWWGAWCHRPDEQAGGAWPVGNPQQAVAEEEAEMGAADKTEKQGWDARALPASSASPLDRKHFPLSSSGLERAGALGALGALRGPLAPDSDHLRLAHLLKWVLSPHAPPHPWLLLGPKASSPSFSLFLHTLPSRKGACGLRVPALGFSRLASSSPISRSHGEQPAALVPPRQQGCGSVTWPGARPARSALAHRRAAGFQGC